MGMDPASEEYAKARSAVSLILVFLMYDYYNNVACCTDIRISICTYKKESGKDLGICHY